MEKMFDFIDEKTDEFPKFNLSRKTIRVKFSNYSMDGLDDCLKKLFMEITCKYDSHNSISINISTDSVDLGSVSEFFKPVASYDDTEFSHFMKNAINNYMSFCIKDVITIVVTCIHISQVTSGSSDDYNESINESIFGDLLNECNIEYCSVCDVTFKSASLFREHLCYMPIAKNTESSSENNAFVFYDFETMQEKTKEDESRKIHKVNLCVAQQVCDKCNKPGRLDNSRKCNHCDGGDVRIFDKNPVESFMHYLFYEKRPKNIKAITCIAHNSQGFDCQFILKYLIADGQTPSFIVISGTNIICMSITVRYGFQVRFIDSYNYIKEKLEKFPEIFEFD